MFRAALYSQLPAGTLNVPCHTASDASKPSCVAAQSGCQSPGQPNSLCRLPAIVTADGWAGGGAMLIVSTLVA